MNEVRDDRAPLIPELLDATLVLVRHGESEFIVQGRFQGHAETPLSPTGPSQLLGPQRQPRR